MNLGNLTSDGYCILPTLDVTDFERLERAVVHSWARVLGSYLNTDPSLILNHHKIENYASDFPNIDHEQIWSKKTRMLSETDAKDLCDNLLLLQNLRKVWARAEVIDFEGLGYPEFTWRIVRPSTPDATLDVAEPHKDEWFWRVTNNIELTRQEDYWKIWIGLRLPEGSGLYVQPASHKIDIPYTTEVRHGRPKPKILDSYHHMLVSLPLNEGDPVFFDRRLLHAGTGSSMTGTRVSIEFGVKLS
jgi:hypothetical protein